jgi:magnesium-transporting ATPase (P-type)
MILGFAIGWGVPLTALQLLFINTVANGVPGFALSRELAEDDLMNRKPVPAGSSVFADGFGVKLTVMTLTFTVITLIGFYIGRFVTIEAGGIMPSAQVGKTMAFLVLGFSAILHIFNVRSIKKSIFKLGWMSNPPLFWSAMLTFAILFAVALIKPVAEMFYLTQISPAHWIIVIILSFFAIIAAEIEKYFLRGTGKEQVISNK